MNSIYGQGLSFDLKRGVYSLDPSNLTIEQYTCTCSKQSARPHTAIDCPGWQYTCSILHRKPRRHVTQYFGRYSGKFVATCGVSHHTIPPQSRAQSCLRLIPRCRCGIFLAVGLIRPILERSPLHVRIESLLRVCPCLVLCSSTIFAPSLCTLRLHPSQLETATGKVHRRSGDR